MRADWISGSAAALVFGAPSLLLGFSLSPLPQHQSVAASLQAASDVQDQFLLSALMLFAAAIGLSLGSMALWTLLRARRRNKRLAVLAVAFFTVGTVGMAGYAMALHEALVLCFLAPLVDSPVFRGITTIWMGALLLGLALVSAGLARTNTTPRWVPSLLLLFVASRLVPSSGADFVTIVGLGSLTIGLTGAGLAANEIAQDGLRPAEHDLRRGPRASLPVADSGDLPVATREVFATR